MSERPAIETLESALRFYADEENYIPPTSKSMGPIFIASPITEDGGRRARETLGAWIYD